MSVSERRVHDENIGMNMIRRDAHSVHSSSVEELFHKSGYTVLRDTGGPAAQLWKFPDFANHLSVDAVYQAKDGSLLGHVSVTRAYSHAWLGHQLLTLKGHPESADCRVAIYNHFASIPLELDRDDVFLFGFYNRDLRWHRLFFESFVDRLNDPLQVCSFQLNRFEIDHRRPVSRIDCLNELEVGSALELVQSQLPALAAEALDINSWSLITPSLHSEYSGCGLERARQALVVREGVKLVGVALCDTGPRDFSLFNLFNFAHIYISPDASDVSKLNLFRAVVQYYDVLGIEYPVIVSPSTVQADGFRFEELMGAIVWSASALRKYSNYIHECFDSIDQSSLVQGHK